MNEINRKIVACIFFLVGIALCAIAITIYTAPLYIPIMDWLIRHMISHRIETGSVIVIIGIAMIAMGYLIEKRHKA